MLLNTSSYYDQGYKDAAEEFANAPYHVEYVYHKHVDKTGVERSADYHSVESGGCFTAPVHKQHTHTGSSSKSGGCYTTPVYKQHVHTSSCYRTCTISYSYYMLNNASVHCGGSTMSGHAYNCWAGYARHSVCGAQTLCVKHVSTVTESGDCPRAWTETHQSLICGKTAGQRYKEDGIESYALSCGKTAGTRYDDEAIDYYVLNCGKTETSVDNAYLASGAPDTYVDESNPWYREGLKQAGDRLAKGTAHVEYVYHKHVDKDGKEVSFANAASYKQSTAGGCFSKPVYHTHTSSCYKTTTQSYTAGMRYDGHTYGDGTWYRTAYCTDCGNQIFITGSSGGWGTDAPHTHTRNVQTLICTKSTTADIDYYALSCEKTATSIDSGYIVWD